MTVGELARRTSVSPPTINFYVQQGLLPRPEKLNRTRAAYDERHLQRLAIIKRLQTVHGLPLAVIRRILDQAQDNERLLERLVEQRGPDFAQDLTSVTAPTDQPALTRAALLEASGLTESQLARLEAIGLLRGRGERDLYGEPELQAARAYRRLFELGAGDAELELYREYGEVQRRLTEGVYRPLLTRHRDDWLAGRLSGRELSEAARAVEAYLRFAAGLGQFAGTLQGLLPDDGAGPGAVVATSAPAQEAAADHRGNRRQRRVRSRTREKEQP
jgi:DNA-binding transcriptional MerR regulator